MQEGLLSAWAERGLRSERCHTDATSEAAVCEEVVDLWVVTPTCEKFSRRNHLKTATEQAARAETLDEPAERPSLRRASLADRKKRRLRPEPWAASA